MPNESALTLASNRGPASFVESESGFEMTRSAGGMGPTLHRVARVAGQRSVWIAATVSDSDRRAIQAGALKGIDETLGYRLRLLNIDADTYSSYYEQVSNRLLWFANHCLWDEVGTDPDEATSLEAWEGAYLEVNRRFARTTVEEGERDSLTSIQDFHLAAVPRQLRELQSDRAIHHFTHSSFCSWDAGLGKVPEPIAQGVIKGMLGADLVGLHVPQWVDNFLDCCTRIGADVDRSRWHVRFEGHDSWVRAYPIPVDAANLRDRASTETTRSWANQHLEWAAGRSLIVRADRCEPSKNVVRGFEAFGSLLDKNPELAQKVCFIACVYPSRQSMEEYRAYLVRVQHIVDQINERHPNTIQLYAEDDFDRSLGALLVYDVLLVNPIMDGMNLVSKEGPAINERNGVLVLSRGAGAFQEMGEASITIEDPLDVAETARALEQALGMDEAGRKELWAEARQRAELRRPQEWMDEQLEDLTSIKETGEPLSAAG